MIGLTGQGKRYALVLGAGVLMGLGGGWGLWHPRSVPVERAASAVRQKDSSLVLARNPDTVIKVVHTIPKGWVPERQVEIAVAPKPIIVHDTVPVPGEPGRTVVKVDTVQIPAVRVSLSYARLPDGTHRVVASSPDGTILDSLSVDVPVGPSAKLQRTLKYSAGVTRDLLTGAWGGAITRDLAFLRLEAIGEPAQGTSKAQLKIGVAIRF